MQPSAVGKLQLPTPQHFKSPTPLFVCEIYEQDRQALLMAKYCPQVAPVASADSN